MSTNAVTTTTTTTSKTMAEKKKQFKLRIDLKRSLKRAAFDPIYQLTTNVFPQLEPKDQAKVIVELLPYLYSPITANEPKKRGKLQINTQVNLAQPQLSDDSLKALRELAKSDE